MSRVGVIIVAGGSGLRMGGEMPKQFMMLHSREILLRTLDVFAATLPDLHVVVVLPVIHLITWDQICSKYSDIPLHSVVCGGSTRFESVKNGLEVMPKVDFIAIHDAVRPLVSSQLIVDVLKVAQKNGSAIPVTTPTDSFRVVGADGSKIIDRSTLRAVQTPQIFDARMVRSAYRCNYNPAFTDDASVVESSGVALTLCAGQGDNIKITTPLELSIAETIIINREKKV